MVKLKRATLVILIILNCAIIIYLSHQPARISASQSGGISGFITDHLIPGYNEMPVAEKKVVSKRVDDIVRDVAHGTEYFPLGLLGTVLLGRKRAWLMLLLVGLFAASDEIHQIWIDGRSAQITDWLKDMLGAGVGVLVGSIVGRKRNVNAVKG